MINKRWFRKTVVIWISAGLLFAVGCQDQSTVVEPTEQPSVFDLLVAHSVTDWGEVLVYAPDTVYAGYSQLLIQIRIDGQTVSLEEFRCLPQMSMTAGMFHSTPIDTVYWSDSLAGYRVDLVWVMSSRDPMGNVIGQWYLNVEGRYGGDTLHAAIAVDVHYSEFVKAVRSRLDSSKVIVALALKRPTVGLNDCVLFVYQKGAHGQFWPVEDLEVEIEPEMPSMGHGSPNNQNPVHVRKGRYKGRVNFTMTGEWVIHLRLYRGPQLMAKVDFSVVV